METSKDNLYSWHPITISDRGDGALGSTDKNNGMNFMTTKDIDPFEVRSDAPTWELGDPS
jgi:hypothetical protein